MWTGTIYCYNSLYIIKLQPDKGSLQKKKFQICHGGGGGGQGGFVTKQKKNKIAKMISGSSGAFLFFLVWGDPILWLKGGF